jgi:hypothetical protein
MPGNGLNSTQAVSRLNDPSLHMLKIATFMEHFFCPKAPHKTCANKVVKIFMRKPLHFPMIKGCTNENYFLFLAQ